MSGQGLLDDSHALEASLRSIWSETADERQTRAATETHGEPNGP